jgi:uncharacterized membrane protein YfcA
MDIYLPVAQLSVNWVVILAMGTTAGFLSGMLGVSGGFIMTPLLIFYGIPSGVAVATQASPISAAALVGALAKSARDSVDFKMGFILLIGGIAGSFIGVYIFAYLQRLGQIDFVVELSYVMLLGAVGSMMLVESAQAYRAARRGMPMPGHVAGRHNWIHGLPFKMRFRTSRLYVSAIPVLVLGFLVGIMTAILGTGGAFLLVPAKIYLFRMRTTLAVGTSQFQMCAVAIMTTFTHAVTDHTVDIVLGLLLIVGGVVGAQLGVRLGTKLRSEQLRIVFALLVLAIATQLIITHVRTPPEIYTVMMH